MEKYLGLHERIEITYVVDGYWTELLTDDGQTPVCSAKGNTVQEAMSGLLEELCTHVYPGRVRQYVNSIGRLKLIEDADNRRAMDWR